MKILVINPNTTISMTKTIEGAARRVANSSTEIITRNPTDGPSSIQGYLDEALSLPGILKIAAEVRDVDAIIIACFDDTGLDALRCTTDVPVLGIGEAAFHTASFVANKFSVITTLSRSVAAIEHNLVRYGLASRCAKVRASEIPVLELESDVFKTTNIIKKEIELAIEQDQAEAIVLGCAGMTELTLSLSKEFGLPVLDGVACAVALSESFVRLGLKTSNIGGYVMPN